MNIEYLKIGDLLQQKAEITARLNEISYEGSIEIKDRGGNKYIYLRKKVLGRYTSSYVDVYSDELFAAISKLLKQAKEYRKQLRVLDKKLANLGYSQEELTPRVLLNIDFARANMKVSIYEQALLEGIATTFPDTEAIIDNKKISGMEVNDIQKILNLKRAWEFVLDKDVIAYKSDYAILCHIARLINEGFFTYGGRVRSTPVTIGGTSYIPPLPVEIDVKEKIREILNRKQEVIDKAIDLALYCMKTQIFIDGNKRVAIIFANHYLISKGEGLLVVAENKIEEFKTLLVNYCEGRNIDKIRFFMKQCCWKKF